MKKCQDKFECVYLASAESAKLWEASASGTCARTGKIAGTARRKRIAGNAFDLSVVLQRHQIRQE